MTPHTAACDALRDRALVERYVAGTLPEPEASELEVHYLTCARCQADVRLAAAIAGTPVEAVRRPALRWTGIGLAIAAGLTAVLLVVPRRHAAELGRLGGVPEAPVYLGVQVRGSAAPADSVFDTAMIAYGSRRYGDAIAGLDAALRSGADSAPAEFFRAASRLMIGRNGDAAEGFRRVVAMGSTPYLPESHYYLAKALLRMGRGADAVAALRSIGPERPDVFRPATALADSVEAVAR